MRFNKTSLVIIVLILVFAIGANVLLDTTNKTVLSNNNAEIDETNKQIIEIKAKGGYSPSIVNAKANVDTILRVNTKSTFDCSAALTIPKLGIRKNLPPSASTDIALGPQEAGSQINGTCAMGMYNFVLKFN